MRSSLPSWLLPLALLLPVSTLAAPPEAVSGDFKPLTDDDGYVVALQAVAEATVTIGSDLERSYEQLEVALDSLMEYAPLIAVDPHAQRIQIKGQLSLARAALHLGERDAAVVVMDEVVSSLSLAGELDSFPIESVGPSIGALFRERRAHFEAGNSGRLVVHSPPSSSVFVDSREVSTELINSHGVEVGVGVHRVWVADETALYGEPQLRETVAVGDQGLVVVVDLPHEPVDLAPKLIDPVDDGPPVAGPDLQPAVRLAPRWVSVSLLGLGLGQGVAGALLLSFNGHCSGPSGASSQPCTVHDTRAAGITTATAGASQLVIGAALLVVDELRTRRRRRP